MLNGQHRRVDIPAHARAAHKGLPQKGLEDDLCRIVPRVSPTAQSVKGLYRTAMKWFAQQTGRDRILTTHKKRRGVGRKTSPCLYWRTRRLDVSPFDNHSLVASRDTTLLWASVKWVGGGEEGVGKGWRRTLIRVD